MSRQVPGGGGIALFQHLSVPLFGSQPLRFCRVFSWFSGGVSISPTSWQLLAGDVFGQPSCLFGFAPLCYWGVLLLGGWTVGRSVHSVCLCGLSVCLSVWLFDCLFVCFFGWACFLRQLGLAADSMEARGASAMMAATLTQFTFLFYKSVSMRHIGWERMSRFFSFWTGNL